MLLCGAYKLLYAYTYALYIYAKISITIQSLSLIIILFLQFVRTASLKDCFGGRKVLEE